MSNKLIRLGFSFIELIFVIIIIGILAAVAVPRMMTTRSDAVVLRGKSQVMAIRSGIALQKSKNIVKGIKPIYPILLDNAPVNTEHSKLFYFNDNNSSNILEYPLYSKKYDGYWWKIDVKKYQFFISRDLGIIFSYNSTNGIFDCDHNDKYCRQLAE